ncbi:MAG: iron-containing alcohol dehydrogenase [Ignisphaera sp.]
MQTFTMRYGRTVIHFGVGVIRKLGDVISGIKRVFIVTSKSAARISGALNDVESILQLQNISYEVFDGVKPNPEYTIIEQIADHIKKFDPEFVISIGGGSVIDSAKVAAALAVCGGHVKDYILKSKQIYGSKPLIAVNLTHGTGSEINRYAVVTIDKPRTKFGIASDYFYPMVSFEDPRYTITMPLKQVLYTAIDAFYHAYEAATGRDSSPFVFMIAEEASRLIVRWLPIALKDPKNIEARYWLLYASMLAGIAIDNSRAHIIHAIENVLSGINTDLPHGAGLAMIGPAAVMYIHRAVPEHSYRILRQIDPSLRPNEEDAEKASRAVIIFEKSVEFNEKLSDYGFSEKDVEIIVNTVVNVLSHNLKLTPFNVDVEVIKSIYLNSL